jgi:tetratricopeptide (TPR) repeat protein
LNILYNIGLIYSNNGDFLKAVEYYQQALDLNSRLPQALNNIAVIYHYQGTKASEKKEFELAQNMFDKASDYWKNAVRLAPNNYIEAQNWLKINGKMAENEGF